MTAITVHRDVVLGRGDHSTIFKGLLDGHDVAVKELHRSQDGSSSTMVRCPCPHIIQVLAHDDARVVLEYMDAGNLRQFLDRSRGPLPMPFKLQVALRMALALKDLHGLNIVHGNVKSANVLLSSTKGAKLTDFGHAGAHVDALWSVAGPPFWTAPEIIETNGPRTTAADIYSLGVVLTELDTLQRPYASATLNSLAVLREICAGLRRPELSADSPAWYRDLVAACLAHDPSARPEAALVVDVLYQHLDPSVPWSLPHHTSTSV
ncbi:protein kinase [Achlya hypogyna]|uniref:Protein kinase n=1 Tax=Achlya hypogyna TaxID=1202772 RepID=A0A1V9YLZ0_ACHHY|nr:protein kinase [Achlya hypogyna]